MATYKTLKGILLWSEDYKALAQWYQDKFGFTVQEELTHPNDTGISLTVGDSFIWCGKHSEVHGKNKDPFRIMYNINVEGVQELYEQLAAKGVEFIAKPFKAPTFDKYFATFVDLDGNVGQLIGNL